VQDRLIFEAPDAAHEYRLPDLPNLAAADTLVLDFETTGLSWQTGDRPVGLAVLPLSHGAQGPATYLPFGHRQGPNLSEDQVKQWYCNTTHGKRLVFHNASFDLLMGKAWGADVRDTCAGLDDTMLMAALLDDHRRTFSLKALGEAEGLPPKLDLEGETIFRQHAAVVAPYACRDVELTAALYQRFGRRLIKENQEEVLDLEGQTIAATVEMMWNGLPLDVETAERWRRELLALSEEYLWQAYRLTGRLCSPDKAADWAYLLAREGFVAGRTATGAASYTADVLVPLTEKSEAIRLVFRAGKARDLVTKFLTPWLDKHIDGVLYPSLFQLRNDEGGTVSGRYSCANPNAQQILSEDKYTRMYGWLPGNYRLKNLFRAPEGEVWWSADAKGIEMRLFADYSGSERLIRAYEENPRMDPHALVTSWIKPFRPNVTRTEAKQGSFSKLYGSGIGTFAATLGVTRSEAQQIMNAYDAALPEARALFNKAMRTAETRGFVRTRMGRRTRFPVQADGTRWRLHKSLNGVIQGFAADLNKLALCDLYANRKGLDITMRLTVHDSAENTMPLESIAAATAIIQRQRYPLRVPILWDVKTGPSMGEAK
jgi:DNA polymerase-1